MADLGALEKSLQQAWRTILNETMQAFVGVDVPGYANIAGATRLSIS
jgi:hypothetical protein